MVRCGVRAHRHGSGTPLVFLHGAGVDHRILTSLEAVFTASPTLDRRWERVYLDLPGSAGSVCPPSIDGSDAVVDAILDFMHESFPGEPFALVGNSWGGMLARSIASRRDSRTLGLALICPTVVADQQRRTLPPRTVIHHDSGAALVSAGAGPHGLRGDVGDPDARELEALP
ncbi:alpha/beta fold hydrolase [Sphingomonas sp. LR61]|uniref:alpha/beta fold hydrolase n=1 Tax=Sphingomonas sp. LR61 TaxID=3050234 RepID=UPI003FA753F9